MSNSASIPHHKIWEIEDLQDLFDELNRRFFDGFLDEPAFNWNSRLRTSAGRFFPGSRKYLSLIPPKIELATYLLDEPNAEELIRDTMGHEMIHYWLWVLHRPYGHTPEFYAKMRQMGVSRYNSVPRKRDYKWVYRCTHCRNAFPARRRLARTLACAKCCKQFSNGKFDQRFKLFLEGPYVGEASPTPEPVA